MAKRSKRAKKSQTKMKELVVVALARDWEQAKDYETLLKNNDIPAVIKEHYDEPAGDQGIVVMVPEEYFDEAHVVVESQDAYDDFYDFMLEEDGDFDGDIFDEDEF